MKKGWTSLAFLAVFVSLSKCHNEFTDRKVSSAQVVACIECRLKRLPEVRMFISEDVPLFHNVEFKAKPGDDPNLLLLNAGGHTVERIALSQFSRVRCNNLLIRKGFYRKDYKDQEVPEQYRSVPQIQRQEL